MSKILIIEDQKDIQENLEEYLEHSNSTVISAANRREGITFIQQNIPDIILCNVKMPELYGFQVL